MIELLPILFSLLALIVASGQFWINKSKLRLDLYNRRFSVFDRTLSYYLAYMAQEDDSKILARCALDFVSAYRESIFLFGKDSDVYKILTQLKDTLGFLIQFEKNSNQSGMIMKNMLLGQKLKQQPPIRQNC